MIQPNSFTSDAILLKGKSVGGIRMYLILYIFILFYLLRTCLALDGNIFSPGQAYTALSRYPSYDDITISLSPIKT